MWHMGNATVAADGTIQLSPELREQVQLAPGTALQVSVSPDGKGFFMSMEGDRRVITSWLFDQLADKDLDPGLDIEAATRAARKLLFEEHFGEG